MLIDGTREDCGHGRAMKEGAAALLIAGESRKTSCNMRFAVESFDNVHCTAQQYVALSSLPTLAIVRLTPCELHTMLFLTARHVLRRGSEARTTRALHLCFRELQVVAGQEGEELVGQLVGERAGTNDD